MGIDVLFICKADVHNNAFLIFISNMSEALWKSKATQQRTQHKWWQNKYCKETKLKIQHKLSQNTTF